MAMRYGVDHVPTASCRISTGKYAGDIGLEGNRIDLDEIPFHRQVSDGVVQQRVLNRLAKRRHDQIHIKGNYLAFDRHGTSPSRFIRCPKPHPVADDLGYVTVSASYFRRRQEIVDLNAFGFGRLELFKADRHLFSRTPVQNERVRRTQPICGSYRIHGRIPAADYRDDLAFDIDGRFARVDLPEVVHPMDDSTQILPRNSQLAALVGAHCDKDGLESLIEEILERQVGPDRCIYSDFDPSLFYQANLVIENVIGQPVFRDTHTKHSTGLAERLKNNRPKTLSSHVICGSKAGGSRSDDGNLLSAFDIGTFFSRFGVLHLVVGRKPLKSPNLDRFVHVCPVALIFAESADPAANGRKRNRLPDQVDRFFELAAADQGDISVGVAACRAGIGTGRCPSLLDAEDIRSCLRERSVNSIALRKTLVELIRPCDRTDLCALSTPGALCLVHVSSVFLHIDHEVAGNAGHFFNLGAGQKVDVDMARTVDQFRRNDAHGAVVGGEGLVQLGHDSPDNGGFLHEMNFVATVGKVKGCLDSSDSRPNYHDRTDSLVCSLYPGLAVRFS